MACQAPVMKDTSLRRGRVSSPNRRTNIVKGQDFAATVDRRYDVRCLNADLYRSYSLDLCFAMASALR